MTEDLPDRTRSERSQNESEIWHDRHTLRDKGDFFDRVDDLVEEGVFDNRSEAIRELARIGMGNLDTDDVDERNV
jgi:hypothetical protein